MLHAKVSLVKRVLSPICEVHFLDTLQEEVQLIFVEYGQDFSRDDLVEAPHELSHLLPALVNQVIARETPNIILDVVLGH